MFAGPAISRTKLDQQQFVSICTFVNSVTVLTNCVIFFTAIHSSLRRASSVNRSDSTYDLLSKNISNESFKLIILHLACRSTKVLYRCKNKSRKLRGNQQIDEITEGNKSRSGSKEGSDVESWDGNELGLEECLFCSHISSSLETNFTHMTTKHGFFLPDAEFVCDLEGLVVYLGEMISQGHMCLWCNQRSKLFRSVRDVQRHMVDKGHCKMKHDESNRHEYADFYDYRSSYPDADQPEGGEEAESIDPEMLVSSGFELVLPSGWSIGHRSLASYYKQNHGRRQVAKRTALSKVLAGYRALGWSGTTDAAVKQRAKDVHYLQRMKNKFRMKVETRANKMQFHYRDQNPI